MALPLLRSVVTSVRFTGIQISPAAAAVLVPAMLAATLACRESGDVSMAAASAAREGVLRVVGPFEITSLDPLRSGYIFTRMQVTETLTAAADDGSPLPELADGWAVSAAGLVWRFDLRPHARFHDGSLVTAGDVVGALTRARVDPGALALAPVDRIAADGHAIVIHLTRSFAQLPALLAHSSVQVLAPASFDSGGNVRTIIGTGPYRIASLEPPQKFAVARFEGWTGARPSIERAGYLAAGRAETRALLAESGQADLVFGLDPASVARLSAHADQKVISVTTPRSILLKVNAGLPSLADVRARQAISLAIDRKGIARAILRDPEMAATQLFPPTLRAWHSPGLTPLSMDKALAGRLLATEPAGQADPGRQPWAACCSG